MENEPKGYTLAFNFFRNIDPSMKKMIVIAAFNPVRKRNLIKKPIRCNNLAFVGAVMKKTALAIMLILLIFFSIVAGILLVDWKGTEEEGELYTYPLSI